MKLFVDVSVVSPPRRRRLLPFSVFLLSWALLEPPTSRSSCCCRCPSDYMAMLWLYNAHTNFFYVIFSSYFINLLSPFLFPFASSFFGVLKKDFWQFSGLTCRIFFKCFVFFAQESSSMNWHWHQDVVLCCLVWVSFMILVFISSNWPERATFQVSSCVSPNRCLCVSSSMNVVSLTTFSKN